MMIFTNMGLDELCFETSNMLKRDLTEKEIITIVDLLENAESLGEEDEAF